jgi:hypothetical protein
LALTPGSRLGPSEVSISIGAGGMGEDELMDQMPGLSFVPKLARSRKAQP